MLTRYVLYCSFKAEEASGLAQRIEESRRFGSNVRLALI